MFDHRNKYTGNYRMTVTYEKWNLNDGITASGTYESDGRVWYSKKDDAKDVLHFTCSDSLEYVFEVDKKGRIHCTYGLYYTTQIGRFSDKKKFHLVFGGQCAGNGQGGGVEYIVDGERK